MERSIYFDGWYKNNHCYHPSLPFRSMQMVDDIELYKGTMLVWSALGGGSISLSYLEHEAFGEVDPRLRFYGFMNDSEFIRECDKRGIKVFGIVFEVQGWEFPAVIGTDKNGDMVLKELNVQTEQGEPSAWYGLREFTQDKYWEVFGKKLKDYFPDGLYNSDGDEVKDIWEECCARTYKGEPVHARWVEVVNHRQIAYQMCRNNPVWREYLKRIMEIQIDAGVHGIQLDESELPMTSIGEGGCFCKDCMKGFREYLKDLKNKGMLCNALANEDLDSFHYGEYLNRNNLDYPVYYEDVPLYKYYWEYQLRQIKKYFKELVDHAKAYSKGTRGDEVLISGNFFTIMPSYFSMEPYVDVVITEMKNTLFRQPAWYRYAAGFVKDKPMIVAENPYGGVVPQLLEMLDQGKGYDLYRIFLLEASVYGCNMSVPYGGWMGNTIKDSFYPPREVTAGVQTFLAEHEYLFSKNSGANLAVIYSFPSYYWREAVAGYSNNVVSNADNDLLSYQNEDADSPNSSRLPFWEVLREISDDQACYDVLMWADGELREDTFSIKDIESYDYLILPDCTVLTQNQLEVLEAFLKTGKKVIVFGRLAENIEGAKDRVLAYDSAVFCDNPLDKRLAVASFIETFHKTYAEDRKIILSDKTLGVQTHKLAEDRHAIHIINYNYDKESDEVEVMKELTVTIDKNVRTVAVHTLGNEAKKVGVEVRSVSDKSEIILRDVPAYVVLEVTV